MIGACVEYYVGEGLFGGMKFLKQAVFHNFHFTKMFPENCNQAEHILTITNLFLQWNLGNICPLIVFTYIMISKVELQAIKV